jgi:selenocysteine lyase/cysteine desulfurase
VLICSPYKFFGPHMGLGYVRAQLASQWRTYKVRPAIHPFETGTLAHELLAGFVAAVEYVESIGWHAIRAHERSLGQQFLDGLPGSCTLYGPPTMDGRVPTFAFTVECRSARAVAESLGERDIATWDGDYYAVEVMQRLGLGTAGAVRAGFVHYNTPAEVERLLHALEEL